MLFAQTRDERDGRELEQRTSTSLETRNPVENDGLTQPKGGETGEKNPWLEEETRAGKERQMKKRTGRIVKVERKKEWIVQWEKEGP